MMEEFLPDQQQVFSRFFWKCQCQIIQYYLFSITNNVKNKDIEQIRDKVQQAEWHNRNQPDQGINQYVY